MKIPIAMTTFNRAKHLRVTAESYGKTLWPSGVEPELHVWDDGSKVTIAPMVGRMVPAKVHFPGRVGMLLNYQRAMNHAVCRARAMDVPFFVTLDSDVWLHPEWMIRVLDVYMRLRGQGEIVAQVSAFTWEGYGPMTEHDGFRLLHEAGAACCLFDLAFWTEHDIAEKTRVRFEESQARVDRGKKRNVVACEYYVSKFAHATGALIVGTSPSYAQHLGVDSHSSPNANLAVATDFVGDA